MLAAPAEPGLQGASSEESQVPRAEQKKSEIKQQLVLFVFLLPDVAMVELLNQTTSNHVSETCAYIPFSLIPYCMQKLLACKKEG